MRELEHARRNEPAMRANVCQPCYECHQGDDEVDGTCPCGPGAPREIGEECSFDEDCLSGQCEGVDEGNFCAANPEKTECESRCTPDGDCCEWHEPDCRRPESRGDGDCDIA